MYCEIISYNGLIHFQEKYMMMRKDLPRNKEVCKIRKKVKLQ